MNGPGPTGKERENPEDQEKKLRQNLSGVAHRWLVLSGKGGVGKSTVAVNLACALAARGFKVGLLDTDIHGPNVPKMLGIEGMTFSGTEHALEPIKAYLRIKVVSLASLMPDPDTAIIWRGPKKMGIIRQFLADVNWGALDHLVVDSPPGTGDEPLSSAQLIDQVDGAIIVTSPQEVAVLDSRKCVDFARELKLPVAGIVENMSGMRCPHCDMPLDMFGVGGGKKAAQGLGVPYLGAIPFDPAIVESGDRGLPFMQFNKRSKAAGAFSKIVDGILATAKNGDVSRREEVKQMDEVKNKQIKVIAVASEDDRGMEGQVSGHFGRCPHFTMVEVDGDRVVAHRVAANLHFGGHKPGVMPEFIKSLGADVILAGGMGPRAVEMFDSFGIEVATGAEGKVRDALERYLTGQLKGIVPCNHDHPESCGAHDAHDPCGASPEPKPGLADQPIVRLGATRVAVPAKSDSGLGAAVDPRFGRAPFYVLMDLESGEVLYTLPNTAAEAAHGAGISAARLMGEREVQAVIAGRFGPKAHDALVGLGITLWAAPDGLTVGQALERLKQGSLTQVSQGAA